MITNFNKYKKINESASYELTQQFDEEFIEKFFKEHMKIDAEEICELWPSRIWYFVDDDRYIEDLIEEEKSNLDMDYFGEYDYKQYLEENMTDNKEEKILNIYNEKNEDEDEEEYYSSDMLDDLTEKQLREIIEDGDEEDEFMEFAVEKKYSGQSAEDVAHEIYDMDNGRELYNAFYNYIDEKALEEDYDYNTNKFEEIQEQISNYIELQEKLFDMDKSNVLLLAELVETNGDYNNIGNTFKFQKAYVKYYNKKNNSYNKGEDGYKEEKSELTQDALEYIDKNFKIDDRLKDIYPEEMDAIILKHNIKNYNI